MTQQLHHLIQRLSDAEIAFVNHGDGFALWAAIVAFSFLARPQLTPAAALDAPK